MNQPSNPLACKVLVIGGGGAGLRAALAAADTLSAEEVLLVTKGRLGASGTTALAYSDRMAFHAALPHTEPSFEEAVRTHAGDIYRVGGEVSDGVLARTLAEGGRGAFDYLEKLGVPFVRRNDGLPDQFVTDGSLYPRACYTGPDTAVQIHKALLAESRRREIRAIENHSLVELILQDGAVTGARFSGSGRENLIVSSPATILATGGPGSIFQFNAFPDGMDGEAAAAAFEAGAELVNMEFIQIGICSVRTKLACSGSLMRALPRFVDETGREFLCDYLEQPGELLETVFRKGASWPVSAEEPPHIIDVACAGVVNRGGKVFLDYSRPSAAEKAGIPDLEQFHREGFRDIISLSPPIERLKRANARAIEWLKARGIDLNRGEKIEVAPSIQHFQGGIRINERAETTLPGLYAAGEAAGGQHGANRPGGNALLDCQVMGRIAGEQAAEAASSLPVPQHAMDREGAFPGATRDDGTLNHVRSTIYKSAGVIRRRETAEKALSELENIVSGDPRVRAACLTGRAVLTSILQRPESRGPHLFFKNDSLELIPRDDARYKHMTVLHLEEGHIYARAETPRPLP